MPKEKGSHSSSTSDDSLDNPDAEGSQVANGKPTVRLRQPVHLHIKGLTSQVTKEDIAEIFGNFGALTVVDRFQGHLGNGYACVKYARPEDCACAIELMDGGLIDGNRITVSTFQ
ncbi:RNA-binding protein with serine-rich domain 1-B-like [Drosophila rhopaloa]|uniref:RNA-binding protein with serine-rich domain 1-B-like n=1 Tax=Drosophila rhopaloa TaxID=1041015 RepID=A0A6P4ELK0_DRORH|nr:RNA-binding protein with serine-rich domain 1-B-like [Drosophila rhopaloa]